MIKSKTHNTPFVNLSVENCYFEITGNSFSDQSDDVFAEILKWIDDELPKLECHLTCVFYLNVFNSITYKNILSILKKFEDLRKNGKEISVDWCCHIEDEDNLELANDIKALFKIPFNIIEKNEVI